MNIEFYNLPDGSQPALDFMDTLEPKMRAKMIRAVDLLEKYGYMLRPPESKELDDGIMELRVSFGNNITRMLYFFFIGNTAVLTNGFVKKTQKTPKKEIQLAKKYRADYIRRHSHENLE